MKVFKRANVLLIVPEDNWKEEIEAAGIYDIERWYEMM